MKEIQTYQLQLSACTRARVKPRKMAMRNTRNTTFGGLNLSDLQDDTDAKGLHQRRKWTCVVTVIKKKLKDDNNRWSCYY